MITYKKLIYNCKLEKARIKRKQVGRVGALGIFVCGQSTTAGGLSLRFEFVFIVRDILV